MTSSNAVLQRRDDPRYAVDADSPQDTVLEAQGLTISYRRASAPDKTVLAGFSLRIQAGEIIAVLGPSGIGKTSLLKILAGLQKPEQGQVAVNGQVLTGPHPRVSLVFQDPCLLPWKTLETNIGFGLDFKHQPAVSSEEKTRRIDDAIAETGLDGARGSYPAELSGGMAQRVALARGIARQPEIMLLDEPFSALDEITRGEMQELLLKITAHHRTAAILVTHDIDEALMVSDRIVLIGGAPPARLMNEWTINLPHPRDDTVPDFAATRTAIVRAMRKARSAMAGTPVLDA
jgi:NitT/TauT family transport system ATP-binding protein